MSEKDIPEDDLEILGLRQQRLDKLSDNDKWMYENSAEIDRVFEDFADRVVTDKYEKFTRDLLEHNFEGDYLDGGEIEEMALKHNIIRYKKNRDDYIEFADEEKEET